MRINGTNLSMIRGDSEAIKVTCDPAFSAGDTVAMQVRKNANDDNALITKEITSFDDGAAVIAFLPEETEIIMPGKYVYDIQVTWSDDQVKTIVEKSEFEIREDVTRID